MIDCAVANIRSGTHKLVYLLPGGRPWVDDIVPTNGSTPGNQGEQPFRGFDTFRLESMRARMYPEEGERLCTVSKYFCSPTDERSGHT